MNASIFWENKVVFNSGPMKIILPFKVMLKEMLDIVSDGSNIGGQDFNGFLKPIKI